MAWRNKSRPPVEAKRFHPTMLLANLRGLKVKSSQIQAGFP
jgi:hypothetical protein